MSMPAEIHDIASALRQAVAHQQGGRFNEAEHIYLSILQHHPDHPDANHLLGVLLHQNGHRQAGLELIQKAIRIKADFAGYHLSLGNALLAEGRLDEARLSYLESLKLRVEYPQAHLNLGTVYDELGRYDEAVGCFRKAIELNPGFAQAYHNLANVLIKTDALEEAEICIRKTMELAADLYDTPGLTADPYGAYIVLGNILQKRRRLVQAGVAYQKAVSLQDDSPLAHYNLGNVYTAMGEAVQAIECYRRSLALDPQNIQAHANLLLTMNYCPHITQNEIYREACRWSARHAAHLRPSTPVQFENSRQPDRRLKIAYLSPDFRGHSVAYFILPVLEAHNRTEFEVFCYYTGSQWDAVTGQCKNLADRWLQGDQMSDDEITEQIRADQIDILVDLAGHTQDSRLLVFARNPSPVQVSWLGYPNTTGLDNIDYRLTDAIADPLGAGDNLHSEKLIRLNGGFLCYQPDAAAPEVSELPALMNGYVTFGSFNSLAKVTDEVIQCWADILNAVADSRLLLKSTAFSDVEVGEALQRKFTRKGIAAERLELIGWLEKPEEHLDLYSKLDIALDTFPYNGTTTTCEALWMGVPVLTLSGNRHAARVGSSIIHQVGLPELVADSVIDYVDKAKALAADQDKLRFMRENIRVAMQSSNLMNKKHFTRTVESQFRRMWVNWCKDS